jgi:predicted DNA-binding transcriptional regulator AlpA
MRNERTKPRPTGGTKIVPGPVLRRPEAMAYCALRDTQFAELVLHDPSFPKPFKVSDAGRTVVWVRKELDDWLARRIAKRDAERAELSPPPPKRPVGRPRKEAV